MGRGRSPAGGCALDPEVPALLLRIDHNPFHHGTLGAARSLGRAGVTVHAIAEGGRGPLARSRYVLRTYRQPSVTAGAFGVHAALREAAAGLGTPAVLLPMDDLGAIEAARLPPALAARFLLPAQPPGLAARVADKAELAGVCAEAGVPYPKTVRPGGAAEAEAAARRLGRPVVAKWSKPWLLPPGRGLRSTTLLRSPREAAALYERTPEAGSALLLQEFLPPGPGGDWFCHAYADRAGRLRAGGTGRKLRSWPPGAGLTAVGRWEHDARIADSARRLVETLGYRGILDLDLRIDAAGGVPRLLDFNPRPGAQFRLFTDRGGLDVVRALHLDLTGRPLPGRAPAPGRRFTVGTYALLSALKGRAGTERAPAATGDGADSAGGGGDGGGGPAATGGPGDARRRGGREGAWWAADDPVPALVMSLAWTLHLARRASTRRTPARPRPAEPTVRTGSAESAAPEESAVRTGSAESAAPAESPVRTGPAESPAAAAPATSAAHAEKASSTSCTTS
ncbi:ATP-grasp domain-containing protein [Streptomyces sp. NPDC007088]|uniref:carboxylate--amine ligase n=1 Tax=Streptomyces sp. NPDC007088 TaxID=3364773 RepID=UPI0036B9150D